MNYVELREKEMEEYFKTKSKEFILENMEKRNSETDFNNYLKILFDEVKIRYILNTPSSLINLIHKKLIDIETINTLFSIYFSPNAECWQKYWFSCVSQIWEKNCSNQSINLLVEEIGKKNIRELFELSQKILKKEKKK